MSNKLTFLIRVNGTNMSFKMFSPVETFSAAFNFTDIHSSVLGVDNVRITGKPGWYAAPTAFLGQIRDRNW